MPHSPRQPQPSALGADLPPVPGAEAPPAWNATIWGKPVAQARPRFARRGKFISTYSTQETEAGRLLVELRQAWGLGSAPLVAPVEVELVFGVPIPASAGKTKRLAMVRGEILPGKKADLDNYVKFILDVGNGILWVDDALICTLRAKKIYAEKPFTWIKVVQ